MVRTQFPVETDSPTVGVVLSTGVHVLKLTVTDDAGLVSAPDRVVISVRSIPRPDAVTIVPTAGGQGTIVHAVIYGVDLDTVTSVAILADGKPDEYLSVEIRPGGTSEKLPIRIVIRDEAVPGRRTIEIRSVIGIDTLAFDVERKAVPDVQRVRPDQGYLGNQQPQSVTLMGANLGQASDVEFLLRGRVDDQVAATIDRSTDESIGLHVRISCNAELGRRRLRVSTARGTGETPASIGYSVVPGYLQIAIIIITLGLAALYLFRLLPVQCIIYLLLIAGMYLPLPPLATTRPWVRLFLAVFALINLLYFLYSSVLNPGGASATTALGLLSAAFEVILVALLFVESQSPHWKGKVHTGNSVEEPGE